jgi:two-component system sensor histidine kinase PilS (NtrC family)
VGAEASAGQGMSRVERERQLRWLMTLRVVIITTLLIGAFSIELILRPADTLRPLFMLAAAAYGMVLFYALLDRWLTGTYTFIALQLIGDALVITSFVGITGGIDSPMSFLYLLPISVASMLLYRRGGMVLAGVCWAFYGTLVLFGPNWSIFGVPVSFSAHRDPARIVYFLVAHLVAMFAFALLSSYLSERLRVQGQELDERTGAVAQLKALNENIIGSINSGLITTTLGGQINFLNRGGMQILGLDTGGVEGRSVEELFGLDRGYLQEIRRRLLDDRRIRFERYFDTPDRRQIYLGIAASNLHDRAGSPLGFLFIFQDLTDIQALEQEVRLKERMAALGEMAAGMAHELRNPLASISGAVQYLKGDLRPDGETLELMDIILRESQRLDQTIGDFLTFARPGQFAPEYCDLVRLLENHIRLLEKSSEFKPTHRIDTRFGAERIECYVDPNRMKQVFWNLATNALKAMPGGGTLSICVELHDSGTRLEIGFTDQGTGMDERQLERYFQPFSGSFENGTGLGAAIVYRLIEEHGGKVRLESFAGGGTQVRLSLPRYCSQPAVEKASQPMLRAAGG